MNSLTIILLSVLVSAFAHAQSDGILAGKSLQPTTLQAALSSVTPGSIVIIGENHGFKVHQNQQLAILQTLRSQGHKVSVGMEFFTYTHQPLVQDYRAGTLSEADFLAGIQWGSPSFDFYRDQANFPLLSEGSLTWALNAPRALTSKVAKGGLESLTNEELSLLPPQFTVGRDSYRQRFLGMMPHLPNPAAGERYFLAQSIWDDTMAWRASEFLAQHPQQTLVIIVGDFHVQFGGGLPDRIHARAPHIPVMTFSQVDTADLTSEEIAAEIAPSPTEGPRADFLWLAPL